MQHDRHTALALGRPARRSRSTVSEHASLLTVAACRPPPGTHSPGGADRPHVRS